MKKTRILLSSVLKPVNDTRMFQKLGATLAKLPHTEVHIAGFPGELPVINLGIIFHPFPYFKRLSLGRVNVQFQYWCMLRQLKPELIIISTHELLLVTVLYKLFYGGKIWYDVRENYYLNLTTQNYYPSLIKYLLASSIRLMEYLIAPFINYYLLAEKCYAAELPFLKNKFIILENKFPRLAKDHPPVKKFPIVMNPKQIKLLYSGTISPVHGIFEAIELCRQLHREHAGFALTIIGYCAIPQTLEEIKAIIREQPYITLIGGDTLVPHTQIEEHIRQSDVGLLPYQPHPSTFSCTPTKLFEYLANGLPVLVQLNPYWATRVNQYQAGINLDFRAVDSKELVPQLLLGRFYPEGIPSEVFWGEEEYKLIDLYNNFKPV